MGEEKLKHYVLLWYQTVAFMRWGKSVGTNTHKSETEWKQS